MCPGASLRVAAVFPSPQDRACEIIEDLEANRMVRKMKKRICLVLDCLCAHDFSDKTADLINLQHYVIKEKRLSERETVVIFYDVVRVVEALHKVRSWKESSLPVLGGRVFPHHKTRCFKTSWGRQWPGYRAWMFTVLCIRPHAPSPEVHSLPSLLLTFLDDNVVFVGCGEGPAGLWAGQVNHSVVTSDRDSQRGESLIKHRKQKLFP